MQKIPIVLAADFKCATYQTITLIKSIMTYNKSVIFYILNEDIPQEWFAGLRPFLRELDSEIIDLKIPEEQVNYLRQYVKDIPVPTYFRYFVPQFLREDKVLYLDSDIIVTGDLRPLFDIDLKNNYCAAVSDKNLEQQLDIAHYFNAGMILFNNQKMRQESMTVQLLKLTDKYFDQAMCGDQSILNLAFDKNWLELPKTYNYLVGLEYSYDKEGKKELCWHEPQPPLIIHYVLGILKPWFSNVSTRFKQLWWDYYNLDWQTIINKQPITRDSYIGNLLLFVDSDRPHHLKYLVKTLPQFQFHVVAYSYMSNRLLQLQQYANCKLYPLATSLIIDDLVKECHAFLDINENGDVLNLAQRFIQNNKSVFTFSNSTLSKESLYFYSSITQPEEMVASLKQNLLMTKESIKVLDLYQTLEYVKEHQASVVRFGDGEIDIMAGRSIPYQDYDSQLATELEGLISKSSNPNLLICQSDVFENLDRYTDKAKIFWKEHLKQNLSFYLKVSKADWYGSTFLSRPYIDLKDKSNSPVYFEELKSLWRDKKILIIEGELSRSGVGNDLFSKALKVDRIIGPSRNAYAYKNQLLEEIVKQFNHDLVLIMLGPTAKVLVAELAQLGVWAIDLGHIDSEYEWFKMGVTEKIKLSHKHTAEHNFDENILLLENEEYERQILKRIEG